MRQRPYQFSYAIIFSGAVLVLTCGSLFYLFHATPQDHQEYRQLVAEAHPVNLNEAVAPYTAQQQRKGILKNLLFTRQGSQRLQINLHSQEAMVVVDHQTSATELIEKMNQVDCLMQEELFYVLPDGREAVRQSNGNLLIRGEDPDHIDAWVNSDDPSIFPMQHIRYFEADAASYYYKTDRFVADDVKIFRFTLPGHELRAPSSELKPEMTLIAKRLEFSLTGKEKENTSPAQLILDGEVWLEHQLGTISADRIVLSSQAGQSKYQLGTIELFHNIKIIWAGGSQLECAKAVLDYGSREGRFYGDETQEFVIYQDSRFNETQKTDLIVKSRQMSARLEDLPNPQEEGSKPHSSIGEIIAKDRVVIEYNHDFVATGACAVYRRNAPDSQEETAISSHGLAILYGEDGSEGCQVTNRRGDRIVSPQITIDTIKRDIVFQNPKGSFNIMRRGKEGEKLDFSSEKLIWSNRNGTITLQKQVVLLQKGLGQLENEEEIIIRQQLVDGKKLLQTIEGGGKTTLKRSEDNLLDHTLTCYGRCVVDHVKMEMIMESPRNETGKVLEGKQVHFKDGSGEIFADKALMYYGLAAQTIVPKKLNLKGRIRLFNKHAVQDKGESSLAQYALSDGVEYFPDSQEVLFTSTKGRRVLFYDKANELQVSAPAIKIKRDAITKKESVKGLGDVRFSFIEHELEQLRKQFSLKADEKLKPIETSKGPS